MNRRSAEQEHTMSTTVLTAIFTNYSSTLWHRETMGWQTQAGELYTATDMTTTPAGASMARLATRC